MDYSKSDMRKFHNYELPEEKLEQFEKQLKHEEMNESFENFKLSEQLAAEIYTPGYLDLVNQQKEKFKNGLPQIEQKKKVFFLNRTVLGIAASLCFVVASIFLFKHMDGSNSLTQEMSQSAMASLNLDHLGTIERGDNDASQHPVIELYRAGKYAQVIEEVDAEETSDMLRLLEARSFMHLGDYDRALIMLQKLKTPLFPQQDALLWSLVEVEYALQNQGNLKTYLEEIILNKYPNYNKANNILTNL